MTQNRRPEFDDETSFGNRTGNPNGSLTDQDNPLQLDQLEARLSHAARLGPGERFNLHINPLVAAAAELLAQVVRLSDIGNSGDIKALNAHLCTQIKLFETKAEHHQVPNEQMIAARYVLCTVLDETVLNTAWGGSSDWSRISLLSRFHKETFGGEKFFHLLERLCVNPHKHLHLLELMYLCFALGFEGKYRVADRSGHELDDIRDGLFRQIRHLRGDQLRELSPQWRGVEQPHNGVARIVPRWQLLLITGICLAAMYSGFAWVLGNQRETVLQPFEQTTMAELQQRN
jgi:type VI secretion system protein ImpK